MSTTTPQLDFEGWRQLLRSLCGRYNPEGIEPSAAFVLAFSQSLYHELNDKTGGSPWGNCD
jgi:hypothetical protein